MSLMSDFIDHLQFVSLFPSSGMLQVNSTPSLLAVKFAVTLYPDTRGVSLVKFRFSGSGADKK